METALGDPHQTIDCPHEDVCGVLDCTQCCRFDVTPHPDDCAHHPKCPGCGYPGEYGLNTKTFSFDRCPRCWWPGK